MTDLHKELTQPERNLFSEINEGFEALENCEWVGLTDEEIKDFIATFPIIFTPDDLVIFARAILRKAQEKNT
jgi:hypothetical protein